jgi:succinoglycan biosynthesis transport protein ExoP
MNVTANDDHRSGLVRLIRRRAWIVVLLAVLGAAGAYLAARGETKKYTATASLLFQQQQLGQQVFGYSTATPISDPSVVEATDVQLASAPTVASATASRLGLSGTTVTDDVQVIPAGSSQVVSIQATADSPALAAKLANTYAQQVVNYRKTAQQQLVLQAAGQVRSQLDALLRRSPQSPQVGQVRSRLSQLGVLVALQTGDVQLSNSAKPPRVPSSPSVHRDAGLGLVVGLVVGFALVFLLERIDRRLRDTEDLAALYGLTVLAEVPRSKTLSSRSSSARPPVPDATVAEAFRLLRARLRYFNVDRRLQTLLITSAVPQEGKSTVAWQLAWTAAATAPDEPVLLLEADLRRPSLSFASGLAPAPGLSEALTQADDWHDAVQTIETGPEGGVLHVLTAGTPPPNPTQLIESDKLRSLLAEARDEYAFIVIDAPPALIVSDALALVGQVNGVVVVSRLNHTHRDAATGLRLTLSELDAPVLGVVVNGVPPVGGRYGYGPYEAPAAPSVPRPPRSLSSQ